MEFFNFNLISFVQTAGYAGIFFIIFTESGLLGFFFPGDSLLFAAGFLASQGIFNIVLLVVLELLGAILGVHVGYLLGARMGPKIFNREDSFFFHKDHIERAHIFYERYGGKAIILARFFPIVRTFAPVIAGVGKMQYGKFIFYNIIGAFLWVFSLTFLGYYLGNVIPDIDRYILPIIGIIILFSISPGLWHLWRSRENRS